MKRIALICIALICHSASATDLYCSNDPTQPKRKKHNLLRLDLENETGTHFTTVVDDFGSIVKVIKLPVRKVEATDLRISIRIGGQPYSLNRQTGVYSYDTTVCQVVDDWDERLEKFRASVSKPKTLF